MPGEAVSAAPASRSSSTVLEGIVDVMLTRSNRGQGDRYVELVVDAIDKVLARPGARRGGAAVPA